ncbi:MAG: hypothetical protein CME64_08905 [Halobacteriovoraceae bacterium]|nr:hypothetical protein [Halobacteriovoraceae bacterium]
MAIKLNLRSKDMLSVVLGMNITFHVENEIFQARSPNDWRNLSTASTIKIVAEMLQIRNL